MPAAEEGRGGPLAIEYLPLAALRPYARNARTHSGEQVKQIAASIRRFGFTNPILIDERGEIIAGHGRLEAARAVPLAEVPCIRLAGLSGDERRALVIADNKLALNAGWDTDLLVEELGLLHEGGFDLGLTGFDPGELAELLGAPLADGLRDPDDAPEPPVHPVSRPGDVWLMGAHRIVCGDSTDAATVARCLAGSRPNLMVTDPPYGVEYDPGWRVRAGLAAKVASGKVMNDDRADWREAWALFPGDIAYVWHAGIYAGVVEESLKACGFRVRTQIVWVKTRHVLGRGHYHPQHESALYAVREGAPGDGWQGHDPDAPPGGDGGDGDDDRFAVDHGLAAYAVREGGTGDWRGGRKQSTVWNIQHVKSETGHGTQKPVEAMQRPVLNNSPAGAVVYEPFSGSGTTVIACERTGRACRAIELSEAYTDVAVRRWQDFTGGEATLEGDGRSFAEVAAARPIGAPAGVAAEAAG